VTAPEHCAGCRGFTRDWAAACAGLTLEAVLMAYARHPDGADRPASLAADFLATLKARAENPGLLWREMKPGFWQDWYCEPPGWGAGFRVHPGRDEWSAEDEIPVRRIYAIEVIDAAAQDIIAGTGRRPGGVRPADRARTGTAEWAAAARGTAPEAAPPERPDRAGGGS